MESDDEDIDIQELDIDDDEGIPSTPSPRQAVAPQQQPPIISGLSTIFKAKRTELENGQEAAGLASNAAGSSSSTSVGGTNDTSCSSNGSQVNQKDEYTRFKHPKRKSDEAYYPTAHSPAGGAASIHMSRHGRSSSSSSNNSDNGRDRGYGYMNNNNPAEDRWATAFSPNLRPMHVPGTSPGSNSSGTSPAFDSYLSRRRSIGHNQPGHSSYSPSATSPSQSSFAAYHARASSSSSSNTGGQSPAFGASSPPVNLPLHAHLQQPLVASTEDIIAHLSHSPHAHAELHPCPPPDADEPWIDLPPSIDATMQQQQQQSPSREHAFPHYDISRSPVVIPADVNLERRRSDPSGLPRSPANRPTRKANSSPARVPLRLSLAYTGHGSSPLLDGSGRRTTSPATMTGPQHQHQRGCSASDMNAILSPRSSPREQSPTSQLGRRPASFEGESTLLLTRQRSHSPSGRIPALSISSLQSTSHSQQRSPGFGASQYQQTAAPSSLSPRHTPSPGDASQSPVEMNLSGEETVASPTSPQPKNQSSFFTKDVNLFPPAPDHDLSLPPRSGWDLSDDADVSPLEEKSMEEAQGSFDMSHDSSMGEHDQDSAELRPDMSPSSPTMGTIPLPLMDADDKDKSPEWGAPLDFNRGPVVELETLSPEDAFEADPEGNDGFQIDMDEEGLTPLERIFLFAKSEHANHRETVSRMLPVWLEEVEVCEAVDYILPLFQGLIQDEDYVKEAFASSLDKLMWYFFSHCPLVELSAHHEIIKMSVNADHGDHLDGQLRSAYKEGLSPNIAVSENGLQLFKAEDASSSGANMESVRNAYQDARSDIAGLTPVSGTTLVEPDSGNTMLEDDQQDDAVEVVDRPLLPLDTFHSIVAALLMNEVSTVAAVTQEAIVRFIELLEDKTVKPSDNNQQPEEEASTPKPGEEGKRMHIHRHYDLPDRARLLIRNDLIDEIVLALFRLDERPPAFASLWKDDPSQSKANITMPEVRLQQDSSTTVTPDICFQQDSSSKFSHFFDDPMASMSPTSHEEPDAQQGVFVGLMLIALLAEAHCLPVDLLEEKLLPKVTACARDPLIVLKKQSVEVLASLCKAISDEAVTSAIAPIVMDLSEDNSPTIRRTIATLLPEVVSKIVPEDYRRDYAVTLSDTLVTDTVAMVRQSYSEISGPLIYIFKDDVPEPLIDHFIGFIDYEPSPPAKEAEQDNDVFAPLIPAFATANTDVDMKPTKKSALDWNVQDDHGRAIITAYNLPGVVLSVGQKGWPELKRLHAALALDSTVSQPRYLIASSIHDIASFIGPEQAGSDLIPIFKRLAADDDIEVVMRAFERYPEFLAHIPPTSMQIMANVLCEAWNDKAREDWRLREVLAEGLVALAKVMSHAHVDEVDALLSALKEGLYDRFTAVRMWATKAVPHFWLNLLGCSDEHYRLSSTLWSLSEETHYKHRATYCLALLEMVQDHAIIEQEHMEKLAELAEDRVVDVRLMAARCLSKGFEGGKQFATIHPPEVVKALQSLMSDSSASVRDELRGIDAESITRRRDEIESDTVSREQASDSSDDDEDEALPRSDSRSSNTKTMTASYRSANSATHDEASQTSSSQNHNGYTLDYKESPTLSQEHNEDESDDEVEDVDLDSSTIYEIDLEELASSTTHLPKAQEPIQSPIHRFTPPIPRNTSNSSLSTASRLSNTPPNLPCQLERASSASSWHFSMREEEQYVAIDVTGHA